MLRLGRQWYHAWRHAEFGEVGADEHRGGIRHAPCAAEAEHVVVRQGLWRVDERAVEESWKALTLDWFEHDAFAMGAKNAMVARDANGRNVRVGAGREERHVHARR